MRGFFAKAGEPYAGGDISNARRLGAALWVIATVLVCALLPLSPPDAVIGGWGWIVTAACLAAGLVAARRLVSVAVGWDELLAMSYVGAGQIALLQWLAGGTQTPYGELFIVVVLYAGGIHPPRRVAGVLCAVAVASTAPLFYDEASAGLVAQTLTRLLMWCALGLIAAALMRTVRAQRLGLRHRGDRAEELARVDELTGLPNRRALTETLAAEVSRARRSGAPLSVIVADLDGFKAINDDHGHPAGDACLRAVAGALRSQLRQYDSCFRWGGDELVLVLPEAALDDAEIVCRRTEAAVAVCEAPHGVALGITCAPATLGDEMTADDLLAAADAELLARKVVRRVAAADAG